MQTLCLACRAMATRFELVLCGDNATALRAAGEEALRTIERLEARLSGFRPDSEVAHLNARAAQAPVRVAPDLFALLRRAVQLTRLTDGAFDITVGPLVRCWEAGGDRVQPPPPEALARARAVVGPDLVWFDECERTVRFAREGVMLDLGAMGKGYAVDCAVDILREAGVGHALVHGGTSTVFAQGHPSHAPSWTVAIEAPPSASGHARVEAARPESRIPPAPNLPRRELATVPLCNESLSVSAVWGRWRPGSDHAWGHVLDPRTGQPVQATQLAAVVWPCATEADALSTALLALGRSGQRRLHERFPGLKSLLVTSPAADGSPQVHACGLNVISPR